MIRSWNDAVFGSDGRVLTGSWAGRSSAAGAAGDDVVVLAVWEGGVEGPEREMTRSLGPVVRFAGFEILFLLPILFPMVIVNKRKGSQRYKPTRIM